MTNRLELNWKLDGFVDEQRYYCSETPIDIENLPAPKAIIAGDARTYTDTAIEVGKTYYVAVSSVKGGIEKISQEVEILTGGDEHWDKVVALLHFDGDLADETGRVWTVFNGNIEYLSGVFNGSLDSRSAIIQTQSAIHFEGEDFTIEFMYKGFTNSHNEWAAVFLNRTSSNLDNQIYFGPTSIKTSGAPHEWMLEWSITGSNSQNMRWLMPDLTDRFHHIALCRNVSTIHLFVDGVRVEQLPGYANEITGSLYKSSQPVKIGAPSGLGTVRLQACVDELRITKGVARYTENFTPPDEPFPSN